MLFSAVPYKGAAHRPKIIAPRSITPQGPDCFMNTAPPTTPLTPTQASLPTIGSILGSVLGSTVVDKFGLDPVSAASVIAGLTALGTALFHWIGSKLGVPL